MIHGGGGGDDDDDDDDDESTDAYRQNIHHRQSTTYQYQAGPTLAAGAWHFETPALAHCTAEGAF
jgi:hypothetical protein